MRNLVLAVALALVAVPARAAPARSSVADVLAQLNKRVKLGGVVISPDGARVAWVEQVATPDGPADDRSTIFVADRAHPEQPPRVVTARKGEPCDESELDFSPDGQRLAFLSDAEKKGQLQLHVADVASGKATRLTDLVGRLAKPRFSPDGKTVAVLFIDGRADALGPLGPATRRTGVVDEAVREQELVLVNAAGGGPPRKVSPPELFVYEYVWRPDGKAFAAIAAPGSGDDNWWIAQLHVFDIEPRADRVVHKPALQICEPTFSPDGTKIAFIEGLMSDAGANGGDVFVVPAAGGAAVNVTPRLRGSPASLFWGRPEEIVFSMQLEGDSAIAAVPAAGGKVSVRWRGPSSVSRGWQPGPAFSRDGSLSAAVVETFDRPPEVVSGPPGKWEPLTQRNAGLASLGVKAESVTWKSDRFDVQGWLIAPSVGVAGGKAPMVVIVHGGPAGAARNSWHDDTLLLANQGYFVFLPNPRGSFGQGEAFTRANVKDFGHGDLRDILAGIDAVARRAPIDPDRVGILGHSYGGYMAMWAVTQTRRFRASVASAGIANWQSYYGQNLIDQWMIPYFGKSVYEDPAVYARSSPITFITKVKTPTLVLSGERDAECPLAQSQEFWHALKTLGVETQLVVYADEGHRFRDPKNRRDHDERMVGWFDKHLAPAQAGP